MIRLIFKTEGARTLDYSTLEIDIPEVETLLKCSRPGVYGYTFTRLIGAEIVEELTK